MALVAHLDILDEYINDEEHEVSLIQNHSQNLFFLAKTNLADQRRHFIFYNS